MRAIKLDADELLPFVESGTPGATAAAAERLSDVVENGMYDEWDMNDARVAAVEEFASRLTGEFGEMLAKLTTRSDLEEQDELIRLWDEIRGASL